LNETALRWVEPTPVQVPPEIRDLAGGPGFLAEALIRRGLTDPAQLNAFLDYRAYSPTSPLELPDLGLAADRLEVALRRNQRIGVWGDFDVDGQTATTILVHALQSLGGQVRYYIPVRARDSHGMALPALQTFIAQGLDLIVTCDTGATAHEAAAYARTRQVDLLITDHHTLSAELPTALALVNPQRLNAPSALSALCGAGVAYKLVEELYRRAGRASEADALLDLVALGTVADLARLTGDNRSLVQRGLDLLRGAPRPAFQAMLELAEVSIAQFSEEQISFTLAPRLNALGRLEDANPAVPFFLSPTLAAARPMASHLEALNARRKLLCDQVFQAAQAQLARDSALLQRSVLLLSHASWPAGVLGIVASRMVEIYHRPVILLTTPPGELARGSARSIEGIHITQAIAAAGPLLAGFGGHPMAAGVSLEPANLAKFHRAVDQAVAAQSHGERPVRNLIIDSYLPLENITLDLVKAMDRLAPFGPGNPPLVLASRSLSLLGQSAVGKTGDHLQMLVEDAGNTTRKVIWWQGAGLPQPEGRFDLAYTVRANNYRGQPGIQVEWIAFRPLAENLPLRPARVLVALQDLRGVIDPAAALVPLRGQADAWVFAEGEHNLPGTTFDRYHAQPAAHLLLWSVPPGRSELRSLLERAAPKKVSWFGVPSSSDQPLPFLTRLSGLVRFVIKSRQGQVTIPELAAATAQRDRTVRTGLAWLAARGHLTLQSEDTIAFIILTGSSAAPEQAARLEKDLAYQLQETAAFRTYCHTADLRSLLAET